MRVHKPSLLTAILPVLLAIPELCYAAFTCPVPSSAPGSQQLACFIQDHIISQAMIAFTGITAAAIFYYGIRMIVDAHNEKAFTDVQNSFIYVLSGMIVIALSAAFVNSFFNTISPINLTAGIYSVGTFFRTAAMGVFTMMVVIAGLRMITAQGDEGAFSKWTKVLVGNCIGVMIMFLADAIVIGINRSPGAIVTELVGVGIFILTIIGFSCVLALIIAGILLITSIDESFRDRAKRAIIGTLISLAIVVATYTLIATFAL